MRYVIQDTKRLVNALFLGRRPEGTVRTVKRGGRPVEEGWKVRLWEWNLDCVALSLKTLISDWRIACEKGIGPHSRGEKELRADASSPISQRWTRT